MKKIRLFFTLVLLWLASTCYAAGLAGLNYTTYAASGGSPTVDQNQILSTGTVSTINFDWGGGYVLDSGRWDGVAVRFTGYLRVPTSGVYNFGVTSDDGNNLYINNTQVTACWCDQGPTFNGGSISLTAGEVVPIDLWYYENGGGAMVQLWWFDNGSWQIIPSSMLATDPSYWGSPSVVGTSTSDVVSNSLSTSTVYTDSIPVNTTTNDGGLNSYPGIYYGSSSTTTTTTTTTTPVTTTTYSDGSTAISVGTSSSTSSSSTNYTINFATDPAPIYSANSPNLNGNSIYIKQVYSWADTEVNIVQDGNNNAITGVQEGWAKVDGNGSLISIKQYGQGNIAGIKMNAWGNNIDINQGSTTGDANNNILMFESYGNGNSLALNQKSNENTATIKMTYDINTVNLTQQAGSLNKSYITISGNWNTVNNTQTGSGNLTVVNIAGDQNNATVNQTGSDHSTLLNLIGNKNNVNVTQTGQGDIYSLQQTCTNPAGCSVTVIRNK